MAESESKTDTNGANTESKKEEEAQNGDTKQEAKTVPSKRKATKSSKDDSGQSKTPRRSARHSTSSGPSVDQLISFLLDDAQSLPLSQPKEEAQATQEGKSTYTTATDFSPFQELLSAVILSRPISHALGLRSIRTIFNDPYNFTTPRRIQEAGGEKRHQALWDAKTQHKQKTVEEMELIANTVLGWSDAQEGDVGLAKVKKEGDGDVEKEREFLKGAVKGLGKTGLDIFYRRIQAHQGWEHVYPLIDDRTSKSLEKIGLPHTAEELKKVATKHGKDGKQVFVKLLERSIGVDLEGNVDEVKQQAESG